MLSGWIAMHLLFDYRLLIASDKGTDLTEVRSVSRVYGLFENDIMKRRIQILFDLSKVSKFVFLLLFIGL